jgi:hypothetical protein
MMDFLRSSFVEKGVDMGEEGDWVVVDYPQKKSGKKRKPQKKVPAANKAASTGLKLGCLAMVLGGPLGLLAGLLAAFMVIASFFLGEED